MNPITSPQPGAPDLINQYQQLLQQSGRGMAAADEIAQLNQGAAMARALRASETELPGVQGQGYSASGPTPLQAVATFLQRRRGRNELADMEKQADVLRGQMREGREAYAQTPIMQEQLQNQYQNQRLDTEFKQRQRLEQARMDAERKMPSGKPQVFQLPDGKEVTALVTADGGTDLNGNPIDLTGAIPKEEDQYSNLTGSQKKIVDQSSIALKDLRDIQTTLKSFDKTDVESLLQPGFDVIVRTYTPDDFKNYVNQNQRSFSPRVKQFLLQIAKFDSVERHAMFGSALTRTENAKAEDWLAGAKGQGLAEINMRLDNFARGHLNKLEVINPKALKNVDYEFDYFTNSIVPKLNAPLISESDDIYSMDPSALPFKTEEERELFLINQQLIKQNMSPLEGYKPPRYLYKETQQAAQPQKGRSVREIRGR